MNETTKVVTWQLFLLGTVEYGDDEELIRNRGFYVEKIHMMTVRWQGPRGCPPVVDLAGNEGSPLLGQRGGLCSEQNGAIPMYRINLWHS